MSTIKIFNLSNHLRYGILTHSFSKTQYAVSPLFLNCKKCFFLQYEQARYYQRPPERAGLISKVISNIKDGIKGDKQMQENLKKFQDEAKKLDQSETFQSAKSKLSTFNQLKESVSPYYSKIEESVKDSTKVMSDTVGKIYKDALKSDVVKKGQEVTEELGKSAKDAASRISKQGEELEKTETYKVASKAFSKVKEDLFDDIAKESRPYQAPDKLTRRSQRGIDLNVKNKQYDADDDTQDVVLHKDSKWQAQWKDFKDNNPVVTGLFSLKTKYDESDNIVVRASRVVTDKLTDMFSDVFSQSEQAQTFAEIAKIDPSFSKEDFIKECEFDIIPTVLEAFLRGDLECLQDWCHEGAFSVLSTQIKHNESIGLVNASRILDIRDVDLALAKIMDQGPVLILTFQAQQVSLVKDTKGNVVEGGVDNIENVNYVWAMCRDQSIFDHRSAWRVLEFAIHQATPYI